jgi:hypothetical protein
MLKLTVFSAFCDGESGVGPAYVADYLQRGHTFSIQGDALTVRMKVLRILALAFTSTALLQVNAEDAYD